MINYIAFVKYMDQDEDFADSFFHEKTRSKISRFVLT